MFFFYLYQVAVIVSGLTQQVFPEHVLWPRLHLAWAREQSSWLSRWVQALFHRGLKVWTGPWADRYQEPGQGKGTPAVLGAWPVRQGGWKGDWSCWDTSRGPHVPSLSLPPTWPKISRLQRSPQQHCLREGRWKIKHLTQCCLWETPLVRQVMLMMGHEAQAINRLCSCPMPRRHPHSVDPERKLFSCSELLVKCSWQQV